MATAITTINPRSINITGDYVANSFTASGNVVAGNIKSDHLLYANGSPYVFTTNAAGTNTQVQFNDGNSFAGSNKLTFEKISGTLTVAFISGDGSNVANVNAKTLNGHNDTYFASTIYVDNAISNLVNSAPGILDTLGEIANAIGNDASFITTINNDLANKFDTSSFASSANSAIDVRVTKAFIDNLGIVSNIANTANFANSSNIASSANLANFANFANIANIAYQVDVSNVNGIGNIANVNLDGNPSNILYGNGSFAAAPVTYGDSNVANYLPSYTGNISAGNLTVTGTTDLGSIANINISGGGSGYLLQTDGSGQLSWVDQANVAASATISVGDVFADSFVADGTQTNFTLSTSVTNKKYLTVHIDGIYQTSDIFSVSGNVMTLVAAPVANSIVEVSTISPGSTGSAGTVIASSQPNITSVGTMTQLTVNGVTNLGGVANVKITGGSSNYVLKTDGAGNLSWTAYPDLSSYATSTDVSNAVANLVNSAPSALDTLKELATALGNDASYSTTITNALANKLSTSSFSSTANTWLSSAQTNITSVGTLTGLTVSGDITPSANVTYSLGNATNAFKDLYLSGNTIVLGGASIKADANSGAVTIIPTPTANTPNPTGIVITGSGTVATIATTGGNVTSNAISNVVANATTSPQYGTITLVQTGNITTPFTGVARFYPISNLTITNVFASLGTASSTNLGFMIKKNGSNVGNFTVTANTYRLSGTSANISVSTTDYLTLDITSGTGATDLKVDLQYKLQ